MRRIVSVWLIDWPVTVWSRQSAAQRTTSASPPEAIDPTQPFALIHRTARGAVIHALNPVARRAGLRRGQTQADARAILPTLDCRPAAPDADARALTALATWCERWAPWVATDDLEPGLEGLFLDITGADHLFGGEDAMLEQMRARLAEAGTSSRVAVAPTPGAAWALARYGDPARRTLRTDEAGLRDALAPLPVEALRLDDKLTAQARRLGLKRIGDLYALPRAGLARRFRGQDGLGLVTRLDQALGMTAEAIEPTRPPARYRAWEAYAEPLGDTAGLEARLPGLLADLATALERDGQGARALTLTAFRTDGETRSLSVRTSLPGREQAVWARLFREKGLERIELGFGADALMLMADLTEPLAAQQSALDEAEAKQAESLAGLIDRLSARLGENHVLVSEPVGSWLPERAERLRPALGAKRIRAEDAEGRARPLLMLTAPEPVEAIAELPDGAPARFTWRRVSRRVTRADGPERLSPEWWRPRSDGRLARTRDYYRVEDDQGVRYWLFREGLYGPEYTGAADERAPSWWMHGLFP